MIACSSCLRHRETGLPSCVFLPPDQIQVEIRFVKTSNSSNSSGQAMQTLGTETRTSDNLRSVREHLNLPSQNVVFLSNRHGTRIANRAPQEDLLPPPLQKRTGEDTEITAGHWATGPLQAAPLPCKAPYALLTLEVKVHGEHWS